MRFVYKLVSLSYYCKCSYRQSLDTKHWTGDPFIYNPLFITAKWLSVRGMRSGWGNRSICAVSKLQFHFSQQYSIFRIKSLMVKLGAPWQKVGDWNCSKSTVLHKSGCCILRGPGGERIVDIVPRGTELELQSRRTVWQAAHTRNNPHVNCIGVYCA
jgi:hypothetical protein